MKLLRMTASVLLCFVLIVNAAPLAQAIDEYTGVTVSRNDGTWLWPLPSGVGTITDWCGCPNNATCKVCSAMGKNNVTHLGWQDYFSGHELYLGHQGIDVGCDIGTKVMAMADGTVYKATYSSGRGQCAVMEHPRGDGYSYYSIYQHLNSVTVITTDGRSLSVGENGSSGAAVSAGDQIALSGNTGEGTGAHLHFAIAIASSGLGSAIAQSPDGYYFSNIETVRWVVSDNQTVGQLVINPAADSSFPAQSSMLPGMIAHKGSVRYTTDKTKVDIGGHQWDFFGNCTKCGQTYDWSATRKAVRGLAVLNNDAVSFKRMPYAAADGVDSGMVSGDTVEIRGKFVNAMGETWYELETTGSERYVCEDELTFVYLLKDATYPSGVLTQGSYFELEGTLSSSGTIQSLTGGVYNADGTATQQVKTVFPASKSCDIASTIDTSIMFNQLSAGNYAYGIQATITMDDITETYQVLPLRYFSVGSGSQTVTFDPNGGTVRWTSKTVIPDGPYGELPLPFRNDGMIFMGWYTEKDGGSLVDETTAAAVGNHTLYAHWRKAELTVEQTEEGVWVSASTPNGKANLLAVWYEADGKMTDLQYLSLEETYLLSSEGADWLGIMLVDNETWVPLEENVLLWVSADEWSTWSETAPEQVELYEIESKTFYRGRNKETLISQEVDLKDWELENVEQILGDWGENKTTTTKPTEGDSLQILSSVISYHYQHWHNTYDGYDTNIDSIAYGSNCYQHTCSLSEKLTTVYNMADQGGKTPYLSSTKACQNGFYIWFENGSTTTYTYRERMVVNNYHYYRWDDWSDWQECAPEADEVESTTMYRWRIKNS